LKREEELTLFLIGSKFFKTNLNRLIIQTEGVKNASDIEYLHRMRVASRKLLSGLNTFAESIPKSKLNKWNIELRLLAKELGKARDLDVQSHYLRSYHRTIKNKNHKIGIDRLILRLKQSRAKRQEKIIQAIIDFSKSSFKQEVKLIFDTKVYRKRLTAKRVHDKKFINKIKRIVNKKIKAVIIYDDKIYDPENVTELHELRKANKQLRYTLETFEYYYGEHISAQIKITKSIQDMLGKIHDCDVWIELIPKFIDKEKIRTEEFFGNTKNFRKIESGLRNFLKEVNIERAKEYKNFISYWDELKMSKHWDKIISDMNSLIK
jgi:CHAD domain-containing protein